MFHKKKIFLSLKFFKPIKKRKRNSMLFLVIFSCDKFTVYYVNLNRCTEFKINQPKRKFNFQKKRVRAKE